MTTIADVVLVATQRLTDAANGGGQMTANIIPDNQANNLFGPISRINRADGNVSLRKAIAKALVPTTQTFYGAHAIVASNPANTDVGIIMFNTRSWTDVRSQAASFLESYLVQGPQTRMWAYGTQVAGQRQILVYQPPGVVLPNIGETYVLVQQNVTPNLVQFVRVKNFTSSVQTFTDESGPYQLNVINLAITTPLEFTFVGAEPQRLSVPAPPTVVHLTNVANAAEYYGCARLAADASAADATATLTSVFGQLLPSTLGEEPVESQPPQSVIVTVQTGAAITRNFTQFNGVNLAPGTKFYMGRSILPGSVSIERDGSSIWGRVDDNNGHIVDAGGIVFGTVDYGIGLITVTAGNWFQSTFTITFKPAVDISQSGYFDQQPVTQSTRGYVYVAVLNPLPAPGSTIASYRANGRWYDLIDDGTGALLGPDGAGSGTVRFDSGICTVTTGALPDIGSNVVFSWGSPVQYDIRTGDVDITPPTVNMTLTHPAMPNPGAYGTSSTSLVYQTGTATFTTQAGLGFSGGDVVLMVTANFPDGWMKGTVTSYSGTTLVVNVTSTLGAGGNFYANWRIVELHADAVQVSWTSNSVVNTLVDDGKGNLLGQGGTGTVAYGAGSLSVVPTTLPDPTVGYTVSYKDNPQNVQHLTPSKSGSDISFTLTGAPGVAIAPRSVFIQYTVINPLAYPFLDNGNPNKLIQLVDDGNGHLVDLLYGPVIGSVVDYTSGVVTFNPDLLGGIYSGPTYGPVTQSQWSGHPAFPTNFGLSEITAWSTATLTIPFIDMSAVTVYSTPVTATNTARNDSFPTPPLLLDLTPTTNEPIVVGSVRFDYAGDSYVDRQGTLYRSVSFTTNSGISAGAIDYVSGIATLTDWPAGGSKTLTIRALLCEFGATPIAFLAARVPGQSVRPSSFIIQANRKSDGTLITATADVNGDIITDDMVGHIVTETGFYSVAFGKLVADASLDWGSGLTYVAGDIARVSGVFYKSTVAGNVGHNPTTDGGVHWVLSPQLWYDSGNIISGNIWFPNEALEGSIRISCVVDTFLPLSSDVLGLDPVRLPQDGRVQIFLAGNTLCFRHPLTFTFTGGDATLANGASSAISLPRGGLESVVLYDSSTPTKQIDIGMYTSDLDAGTVTMGSSWNSTGYTQPLKAVHTRGELVLCTDAQITGELAFSPGLVNDYPADESFVSSCLIGPTAGNLQASYDTKFQQTSWTQNPSTLWKDIVQGTSPTSVYNDIDYPIQVLDRDCIDQRVALIFTGSGGGNIAFEELGIIGTFSTGANVAPINPATSGKTTSVTAFTIPVVGTSFGITVGDSTNLRLTDYATIIDTAGHSVTILITAISGVSLTVQLIAINANPATVNAMGAATLTTANPYFLMNWRGFGGGWANGNAIRFNLNGAGFPIWFARSVQVGASETLDDNFLSELRWDV